MILISCLPASSQSWMPILRDERGDTIPYIFPPPDSVYIRHDLIINFRAEALYLNKLCYDMWEQNKQNKGNDNPMSITDGQLTALLNQRFFVDSLIADSSLLAAIKSFGGDSLRRMSFSSPCRDTIAITKRGDTLTNNDFLWLALHLTNDTSAITSAIYLTYFHQDMIVGASLNFLYKPARLPLASRDPLYWDDNDGNYQKSLHPNMSGFERAWDFQVGNESIKVAVLDDGIDYNNCDLGMGNYGPDYKVVDGFNFSIPGQSFIGVHGTSVAGIIGAYTNRIDPDFNNCPCTDNKKCGISGIAGGWVDDDGDLGTGCKLIAFNVHNAVGGFSTENAAVALRSAAATYNVDPYYFGDRFLADITNCSWGLSYYDAPLRDAVNWAYQCGVSQVACSYNIINNDNTLSYPASFDNNWITNVGGSNKFKSRVKYSKFSKYIDFITPAGGNCDNCIYEDVELNDQLVYTSFMGTRVFGTSCGTSVAAPHAAGLIALLRSQDLERGVYETTQTGIPEPEDYENMIKASALDIQENKNWGDDKYAEHYDIYSGWGFLQADNIFNMLDDNYRITHLTYTQGFSPVTLETTPINQEFIDNGHPISKYWVLQSSTQYQATPISQSIIVTLPDKWDVDNDHPLFVWGRSGGAGKSGLNYYSTDDNVIPKHGTQPIYPSGYTQVLSGYGGDTYVDGIFHSLGNTVFPCTLKTYQYYVTRKIDNIVNDYGLIPPNDELAVNISVFGKLKPSSVHENNECIIARNFIATSYPQPAKDILTVKVMMKKPLSLSITIFDCLGNKINELITGQKDSDIQSYNFDISKLARGIYFLNIQSIDESKTMKIIVAED